MDYDNFETSFMKENRKLKMALAITLILTSVSTISIIFQKRYYLYKGKEIFEERPLAVEVCRLGFTSLAGGEPNSHVVTNDIIQVVNNEPFRIRIDKILKLQSLEKETCKIIIQSNKSLLAFKIGLKASSFYPFHYKLIQIDELPVKEEI